MNNQKRNSLRRYPNKEGNSARSRRQRPPRKWVPVSPLPNQKIGPVNTAKTNAKFTRSDYNQQVNNIVQNMEKAIQQLQQENIALKNKLGQTEKTTKTLQAETTDCQTACEVACQTCQNCYTCQTCEQGCEITCQTACELACQDCQTGCEVSCQTGCEVSCQTACYTSCQVACEFCQICYPCHICYSWYT